jgi:Uma2 family endonuclease
MSPVPSSRHQRASTSLGVAIVPFVRRRKLGEFFALPLHIVLAKHVHYEPDLCFIAKDRLPKSDFAKFDGPPDLIIEVISESNRKHDEVTKSRHYELYGVREYWLVDLTKEQIQVWFLEGGRYLSLGIFKRGERVITRVLAGLTLDPAQVF